MAIIYQVQSAGIYIAYGLSSDIKPTVMMPGCLFIETDTARLFSVVNGQWQVLSFLDSDENYLTNAEKAKLSNLYKLSPISNTILPPNYGMYIPSYFEIVSGLYLEIGINSIFEIG